MKNLAAIDNNLDITTKEYVDNAVPTKTSELTNDSGFITTDEKLKTSVTTTTGTYYYPVLTGTSSSAETKKYAEGLNFVMDNNSNWLTIGTSSKGGKLSLLKTHEAIIVLNDNMTTNTTITLPALTGTLALTSDINVSDVTLDGTSVVSSGIAALTSTAVSATDDGNGNVTLVISGVSAASGGSF